MTIQKVTCNSQPLEEGDCIVGLLTEGHKFLHSNLMIQITSYLAKYYTSRSIILNGFKRAP